MTPLEKGPEVVSMDFFFQKVKWKVKLVFPYYFWKTLTTALGAGTNDFEKVF